MPRTIRRPHPGGFTLVELLVVMGIIAALMGILLPALGVAQQSGKAIKCMSNLRQMVVAANGYANENRGSYPIAYYSVTDATTSTTYCWDLTTIGRAGQPPEVVPGLLWDRAGTTAIQQCPSFEGASKLGRRPLHRLQLQHELRPATGSTRTSSPRRR